MFLIKDGEYSRDELTKTITFACKKCGKPLVLRIVDEESGWRRYDCNHRFCSARYLVDVIAPQKPVEIEIQN